MSSTLEYKLRLLVGRRECFIPFPFMTPISRFTSH